MEVKEFVKVDQGIITFGKFKDLKWSDPKVTVEYLEYLRTDKCFLSDENKEIAKRELINRRLCDKQLPLFNNI